MKGRYSVSVISQEFFNRTAFSNNGGHSPPSSPHPVTIKEKKASRRYIGILLALLSSLAFSLGSLLVKRLATDGGYHPFNIAVWRFVGIFLPYIPVLAYYYTRSIRSHGQSIFKGVFVFNPDVTGKEKFKVWALLLVISSLKMTAFWSYVIYSLPNLF
jgi:drug/metabolite transporter (DMT)-like permease